MAKSLKIAKGVSNRATAPVASVKVKLKGKPRGKSFEPGNGFGSAHRFKPGQSGNPNGRSSEEQKAAAEISKALAARLPQRGSKRLLKSASRSFTEKLADEWILQGLRGNWPAIAAISDRLEGKPSTSLTVDQGQDAITLLIASMDGRSDAIGPAEGRQLPRGEDENGPG